MKKVAILDTSVATFNKGDEIIMESARDVIKDITKGCFVVTLPTHTPAFHWYETITDLKFNNRSKEIHEIDLKFVCGTNLLSTNMFGPMTTWNINIFNKKPLQNSILLGVGCGVNSKKINYYTKKLYKSILSKDYMHSVRDERTRHMLEDMGFHAINTGCATLWSLTPEWCSQIESRKSDKVVFTLTDYKKDLKNDQKLINILKKNYKEVYFWPQGMEDYAYFTKFENINGIEIVTPSVEQFSELLNSDIDYIGTRLHAGIYAMKHKKRSIILIVDHRAREMNKSYNLNCLERDNIDDLHQMINSNFVTNPNINIEDIKKWKSQF
ncbi:polysaccharide pyruvyl transferase family protein [Neobacillus drentensis]|uniref:polysaccharide pyruvyl transferase family protein n=1 Tax=Neobacillus drentensis TaxID=220684 RepID=UPI003000F8E8